MHLVTTWFGAVLVGRGQGLERGRYPKDPEAIAERLVLVEDWKVLPEERELMAGRQDLYVTEPRLARAGGDMQPERVEFLRPDDFGYDRKLLPAPMLALPRRPMRKA